MNATSITQQLLASAPASQTLQMELVWVILIAAGLLLVGGFLGTTIGFIITARDMKNTRREAIKMREMRDLAETAHSLALTERERALKELQEKQLLLDEVQHTTQQQLEVTQRNAQQQLEETQRNAQQQLNDTHSSMQQQIDDLQLKLTTNEQTRTEQSAIITQLQTEQTETKTRLSEVLARMTEANNATAEMQAAMQSVESHLHLQRARLAYTTINGDGQTPTSAPIWRDQRLEQMQTQLDSILQHLTPATPTSAPVAEASPVVPEPDTIGVPAPEDALRLEDVKGIGSGYAQRLRDGGINTISDLAAVTPEQLAGIIKAPAFRKPNYAAWVSAARKMTKP